MSLRAASVAPVALVSAAFALLYKDVVPALVRDWWTDDNYSHGFLIVPLSLFLAWERRDRLAGLTRRPAAVGLVVALVGVALLVVGTLGAERFLARISMLAVLTGWILFVYGWPYLRVLALPIALLVLMIPLPALVFNEIAFPLQLVASRAGAAALAALGIPVLREGNVIVLAHTTLEVAEACSGIRSLVSLITLGVLYGYFADPRTGVRIAIVASTVPVAIAANAVRVAGTGIAAGLFGPAAANGFFHTYSGWILFLVAFATIFGLHRLLATSLIVTMRMRPQAAR